METLLMALNGREGIRVIGLTTCERGDLHEVLEKAGIQVSCHVVPEKPRLFYYIRQMLFLIRFCKLNRVDIVHSHLQQVNIVSVFARYFMKANVIIFRHHFQDVEGSSFSDRVSATEKLFDRLINVLSRVIVVPSGGVRKGMLVKEKVRPSKVRILPYIYDFSRYNAPDWNKVGLIRQNHPAHLRLIMVSRLVKLKQHHVVFPLIKELVEDGLDIIMFVLDVGPEEAALKSWIVLNNMENHIIMLGYRTDFIDYMAASDVLIQPSLTDASNSVAKEMAILEKIVVVTENVGDYSDYILDEVNGFLIPHSHPEAKIKAVVRAVYKDKSRYAAMGALLKADVTRMFGVEGSSNVIDQYLRL